MRTIPFPKKSEKKNQTCHPVATSKNVVYLEIIDPPHCGIGLTNLTTKCTYGINSF